MPYTLTYTWSRAAKILITVDFQIVYVTEFAKTTMYVHTSN